MGTKVLKERVEFPDMTGYATDADIAGLQQQISSNDDDIAALKNDLNNVINNSIKVYDGGTFQATPGYTYSYNLANLAGISDPKKWKFVMLTGASGISAVAGGYRSNISRGFNTSVDAYVYGSTGYIRVAGTKTTGYRAAVVTSYVQLQFIAYRIAP